MPQAGAESLNLNGERILEDGGFVLAENVENKKGTTYTLHMEIHDGLIN